MGFNDDLCRKARELYGWKVKFEGTYRKGPLIEITSWIQSQDYPHIEIANEYLGSKSTYGFVDQSQARILLYQQFATIYEGRTSDYHQELLQAALIHLRHTASTKSAHIVIPQFLSTFVNTSHLTILDVNNREVINFRKGIIPIYRCHEPSDIAAVLKDCRLKDNVRE